ncbi:MAG: IS110 family transposase [Kiritimatiellae bacterium]|nr:IS110 family transposase [Kiritimatiellia bacterium]
MGLHCAIDLHGNNGYYGIVDETGKRIFKQRIPNSLPAALAALEPYKKQLKEVVVESTYNWYWLVDGLQADGYKTRLANPAAMQQYSGLKNTDDETDAFFIAELSRLDILPVGHIYPKEDRPVRDLLRRRLLLVRHRTAHILSFQNLIARERGEQISSNNIQKLWPKEVEQFFDDNRLILMGQTNIETIRFLTKQIRKIEKVVLNAVKLKPQYEKLLTVPGIGKILGLTIMMETGELDRFKKVGNYSSFCRCVKSVRKSNDKKKGENNRKNGNKYLCWAYVEAANFIRRYCPEAKKWHQRKAARSKQVVATKALASKICKACYFIMRDQKDFDVKLIFG